MKSIFHLKRATDSFVSCICYSALQDLEPLVPEMKRFTFLYLWFLEGQQIIHFAGKADWRIWPFGLISDHWTPADGKKKSQNNKVKREGCRRKKAGMMQAELCVVSDTVVGFIYLVLAKLWGKNVKGRF